MVELGLHGGVASGSCGDMLNISTLTVNSDLMRKLILSTFLFGDRGSGVFSL